jgi:pyruvate dehydrogenase E2 component (dihydrolipoamide acetyltransferase)
MATLEFKLPDIGEGITEGEIVAWHVAEGDKVAEDQVMVEVMTDKATVTIGAPRAGKIEKLLAAVGHMVRVGDVIVVIQTGNGSRVTSKAPAATASAVGDLKESLPGTAFFAEKRAAVAPTPRRAPAPSSPSVATSASAAPVASETEGTGEEREPLATPATRKLARDLHVDLKDVVPSGPGGRVTREDVERASRPPPATPTLSTPTVREEPGRPSHVAPARTSVPAPAVVSGARVPFVGLRRKIAEHMHESKTTAAHFTFVEECEVDRLVELRARLAADAADSGVELNYLPFVVKAAVLALKKHPMLNARLDVEANELVLQDRYHVGVAAATAQGLVVPVVHDADRLSLLALARETARLGEAARTGTLTHAELTGSTFTVTSLGKQSGYFATPILNFPNVAILGIHRIKDRPVVRDGAVVVGKVMLLSLTFDHRIVDGHVGAAFAYDVIAYLEEPARLLLDL